MTTQPKVCGLVASHCALTRAPPYLKRADYKEIPFRRRFHKEAAKGVPLARLRVHQQRLTIHESLGGWITEPFLVFVWSNVKEFASRDALFEVVPEFGCEQITVVLQEHLLQIAAQA